MLTIVIIIVAGYVCFVAGLAGAWTYDVISRIRRASPRSMPPATPRQIERAFRLNRPDLRIVRERDERDARDRGANRGANR